MVNSHCKEWQKWYLKFVLFFRRTFGVTFRIGFIKEVWQESPHELNSDFLGFNFGVNKRYGVSINNKIYWQHIDGAKINKA